MADIFTEVEEDIRRERLARFWTRYGNLILALAVVFVAGIGGYRAYEWWQAKQSAEAGAKFESASALSAQGNHVEAEPAFAKIAAEAPSGYRTLGRLREAAELAYRDKAAAARSYDALAADAGVGQTVQDLATVRGSLLLVDTAPYEGLRTRLEPLTNAGRPFRHSAREILGLAAWRSGDMAAAKRWFELIATDADTPNGIRERVDQLMALAAADGKS